MPYSIEPRRKVKRAIRSVACERLDIALDHLDGLHGRSPSEVEHAVHEVRKRCKELRALARLVRSDLDDDFATFDRSIRSAAKLLAEFRDAHAVLGILDDLSEADDAADYHGVVVVRSAQAELTEAATTAIRSADPRIGEARALLSDARCTVERWKIRPGTDWLETGLAQTYRRGQRAMRRAMERPTDERLHRWRTSAKTLWYQARLIESAAPSVLSPMVDRLDVLGEALGDDHDLAVLVARIETDSARYGSADVVRQTVELARRQQADLRRRAFRLGATVYAESTGAFVERMVRYWDLGCRFGPELPTGGLAELAAAERSVRPERSFEYERKFLVDDFPEVVEGEHLRQGYLAIDGTVAVRVRSTDSAGCTLTLKAGRGAVRNELEWEVSVDQFEELWAFTEDRRIDKTRYRVPLDGAAPTEAHVAELDVFHGRHEGLALVEVEFETIDEMTAFEPPAWFGDEVTDDPSYTNAALSTRSADPAGSTS